MRERAELQRLAHRAEELSRKGQNASGERVQVSDEAGVDTPLGSDVTKALTPLAGEFADIVAEVLDEWVARREGTASDSSKPHQWARLVNLHAHFLYAGRQIVNDSATGRLADAWRTAQKSVDAGRSRLDDDSIKFRATALAGEVMLGGDGTGSLVFRA
jgi:hypothetical protein